ncbi:hypothetical protein ANN_03335 [Periplaneta americana]|uniref:Uncharacterized protein n=1 Tax=Periplaneta americana TaxID=6978 RepID=A0ABQ8TYR9_PERAM|nr:hypothetical protein ANN_03335 [Periplaneta americana]
MRGSKTKMTFTVTGASKLSQHNVVQFIAAEGVSPIEIRRPMKKVYVDNWMLCARVYEWTKRYQQGRTSLEDDPRLASPTQSSRKKMLLQQTISSGLIGGVQCTKRLRT